MDHNLTRSALWIAIIIQSGLDRWFVNEQGKPMKIMLKLILCRPLAEPYVSGSQSDSILHSFANPQKINSEG